MRMSDLARWRRGAVLGALLLAGGPLAGPSPSAAAEGIAAPPPALGMAVPLPDPGMAGGAADRAPPPGDTPRRPPEPPPAPVLAQPRPKRPPALGGAFPTGNGQLPNQRTGHRHEHVVRDICIGC